MDDDILALEHATAFAGQHSRSEPGNWKNLGAYASHDTDINTAAGRTARDAYRTSCREMLSNALGGYALARGASPRGNLIDIALPRCSTMAECIALYTVLHSAEGAQDQGDYEIEDDAFLTQIAVDASIPTNTVVVARETAHAVYFTYEDAALRGRILTWAVLMKTEDTMYDLFRSVFCDFTDVRNAVRQILREGYNDGRYIALQLEHKADRYTVLSLYNVTLLGVHSLAGYAIDLSAAIMGYVPRDDAVEGPRRGSYEPLDEEGIVQERNRYRLAREGARTVTYICHGYRYLPTMSAAPDRRPDEINIRTLFDGSADLDAEYQTYCHRYPERPYTDNTRFMRSMQVQERTGSLASVMARRYSPGMSIAAFVSNMQLTARRNQSPMDMDHTVRALAQLDIRRGPGTYSDYIRVPRPPPESRKTILDFWPMYRDTWAAFLVPGTQTRLASQLVPTGI